MRNALLQPLSVVEIECRVVQGNDLQRLRQVSPLVVYKDLYFNPMKCSVGIFIADFLNRMLRETAPDEQLWRYITESLRLLDLTHRSIANFHIVFLYGVSLFLGIRPDVAGYRVGAVFDMLAGCYTTVLPSHSHYLRNEEAKVLLLLERMTIANYHHFRFSREERNRILEAMIEYYDLHIPGVASMKSLPVLQSLFE